MTFTGITPPISPEVARNWAPKHAIPDATKEQLQVVGHYLYTREIRKAASKLYGHLIAAHEIGQCIDPALMAQVRDFKNNTVKVNADAHEVALPYLA